MSAMFRNAQTAMATGRVPQTHLILKFGHDYFSMPNAAAPFMCTFAATGAILLTTGVVTSVSLFVLVLFIVPLLLLGLVVLISLLLTCLTGLVALESLVGLEIERTVRTARGD